MDKISYLLAITPPNEVSRKVDEYRKIYKKLISSIEPHITIYPPFHTEDLDIIIKKLSEELFSLKSEEVTLDSIGYFENRNDSNVVYFKPNSKSIIYLKEINSASSVVLKGRVLLKYDDNISDFNPHMTISAGIADKLFTEIKDELTNVAETFTFIVYSVDLYKKIGDIGIWNKINEIKLKA
ncbi:2'-5' RNA ligase family protein [Patescibacteria group bacterium]|nr:2'-5' RNA ligase family protein [Patescibacteria group bacterium]